MKTRIHVNRHNIAANKKTATTDLPVLTAATYKESRRGNRVVIHGPSVLVYSPHKPLACGATVWLETTAEVTVQQR